MYVRSCCSDIVHHTRYLFLLLIPSLFENSDTIFLNLLGTFYSKQVAVQHFGFQFYVRR